MILSLLLSVLEQISLKDGLDIAQSLGLVSAFGWFANQYLSIRDFKIATQRDIQEIKEKEIKTEAKNSEIKSEIKELTTEIRDFRFDLHTIKTVNDIIQDLNTKSE